MINEKLLPEKYQKLIPIILYENSSGSKNTITLNETVANYSYIEIYYKNHNNFYDSVKIDNPNGKRISLYLIEPQTDSTWYIATNLIFVNANSISVERSSEFGEGYHANTNHIYITKVIGYK